MKWTTRHALPNEKHATFENEEYIVRVNLHKDSFEIVSVYNKKSERTYRAERYTAKFMPEMAELVHHTPDGYKANETKDRNETLQALSDKLAEQKQPKKENNKMTNFIFYARNASPIRIEGTIEDMSPNGEYTHIHMSDINDTVVVKTADLYDMDEMALDASRYVDFCENGEILKDADYIRLAREIRESYQNMGKALFAEQVIIEQNRRHTARHDARFNGLSSVAAPRGAHIAGWEVVDYNGATEYTLQDQHKTVQVKIHTEAGYGRNYFKVLQVKDLRTNRTYNASRYFFKHIAEMSRVSSQLFHEFRVNKYQNQLEMETN